MSVTGSVGSSGIKSEELVFRGSFESIFSLNLPGTGSLNGRHVCHCY